MFRPTNTIAAHPGSALIHTICLFNLAYPTFLNWHARCFRLGRDWGDRVHPGPKGESHGNHESRPVLFYLPRRRGGFVPHLRKVGKPLFQIAPPLHPEVHRNDAEVPGLQAWPTGVYHVSTMEHVQPCEPTPG